MNASAMLAKMQPPAGAPASAWSARIAACWQASVHAILEVGRLLAAAKDALPHGEFEAMIEADLPFSNSTARRLMAVAGDPRLTDRAHVHVLPPSWGTLYELTKLNDDEFQRALTGGIIRPDMMRRDLAVVRTPPPRAASPAPEPQSVPPAEPVTIEGTATEIFPTLLPNGARAIMGSRHEPDDSADYFPTPPWATRALCEHVLPRYANARNSTAWEPACGEGHMAEVLREYFHSVIASDLHEYGYGGPEVDFLETDLLADQVDWIITNPPFGDKTEEFVLAALDRARVGVAMFVRLQWLETVGRYEAIFRDHPPTLIAFFAERVPLKKEEFNPKGSTATAYIWLVWRNGLQPQAPFWIPPGQKDGLTKPDDAVRFTAHPVMRKEYVKCEEPLDPESGEILESEAASCPATSASPEPVSEPDPEQAPDAGSPIPENETTSPPETVASSEPAPVSAHSPAGAGSHSHDQLEIPPFLKRQAGNSPANTVEAG